MFVFFFNFSRALCIIDISDTLDSLVLLRRSCIKSENLCLFFHSSISKKFFRIVSLSRSHIPFFLIVMSVVYFVYNSYHLFYINFAFIFHFLWLYFSFLKLFPFQISHYFFSQCSSFSYGSTIFKSSLITFNIHILRFFMIATLLFEDLRALIPQSTIPDSQS